EPIGTTNLGQKYCLVDFQTKYVPALFTPADFSINDGAQRKELEPLLIKLLQCFAKEPGRIVSRQELIDTIWQQSYVDDNAINRAISELRKALQHPELPQSPIKTHHRKGYSLQLPPAARPTQSGQVAHPAGTVTLAAKRKPLWWLSGVAVMVVTVITFGIGSCRRPQRVSRWIGQN
uniref:winged helix-turn-helix domain-containing protein n=1 Tax=Rheinheimera sp. TaxID=1869214 RepID=UPI004047C96E